MDRSLAAEIIKKVRSLDELLGDLEAQLRQIPDESERRPLLRALGGIIVDLDAGLVRPIAREYPDLDPDKDK